jgi:hypothetical protein
MKKILVMLCAVILASIMFMSGTARAQDETKSGLLVSVEELLYSQAGLAALSLGLIFDNMSNNITTVEKDKDDLTTVSASMQIGSTTLKSLLSAEDIEEGDQALLKLLDQANTNYQNAAAELSALCSDGNEEHLTKAAASLSESADIISKVSKYFENE